MINRFKIIVVALCMGTMLNCYATTNSFTEENAIKKGSAVVNLSVISEENLTADSIECEILWNTLLDITNDGKWRKLVPATFHNGSATVPMETLYRDGVTLTIKDKQNKRLGGIGIGLHQEKPLNLTLYFGKNNHLDSVAHSGGTGNVDDKGVYDKIIENFGTTTITNKDDWEDPNRFLAWQLTSMMPTNLSDAFNGVVISNAEKNWITQNLTLAYCAMHILPYEKRAKKWGVDFVGVDSTAIKQPPLEFFGFMNNLDYSPVMLNDFTNNLRQICNSILLDLPVGISPIGNTSINLWQADVKKRLKGIIDNPSQLLLDLLTATSYFNQIQYHERPLSATQISNIVKFYHGSDLEQILLDRNEHPFPNINPLLK